MPHADPEARRENHKKWREANREKRAAWHKRWRHEVAAWLKDQKGTTCHQCGGTFEPQDLHWHHRDPSTKLFAIAAVRKSRAALEAEIAKCDVLCSECHARIHLPPR